MSQSSALASDVRVPLIVAVNGAPPPCGVACCVPENELPSAARVSVQVPRPNPSLQVAVHAGPAAMPLACPSGGLHGQRAQTVAPVWPIVMPLPSKEPVAQTAFQLQTPAHGVAAGAGAGGGAGGAGPGATASGTLTDFGLAAIRISASGVGPTFATMRRRGPVSPSGIVIRRRTLASSSSRSLIVIGHVTATPSLRRQPRTPRRPAIATSA